MRVANAITEKESEVEQDKVVVVDDGKVACDVCRKRYEARGSKTHKAVYKKNKYV
jgi:hypothetical protein